jgi:hypothetical protein
MDARRVKSSTRADSGLCRASIMAWCKAHDEGYYVLGLARNRRLEEGAATRAVRGARALYPGRRVCEKIDSAEIGLLILLGFIV